MQMYHKVYKASGSDTSNCLFNRSKRCLSKSFCKWQVHFYFQHSIVILKIFSNTVMSDIWVIKVKTCLFIYIYTHICTVESNIRQGIISKEKSIKFVDTCNGLVQKVIKFLIATHINRWTHMMMVSESISTSWPFQ